jgi:pseudouridine-5'-phosphate glycosidase
VHRGARETLDISADLGELARSPVAVVSAGAKAILDLPLTLERLESLGVPVVGFGTDDFPAFYTRASGCKLPQRVDDVPTLARLVLAQRSLGRGGVLICNPIPEADALDPDQVEGWIQIALRRAQEGGVGGKALTPFLLATLLELSQGATLPANRALVMHNAHLAARLAVQMCS